ncbi:hypothetical protein HDU97_006893 [Phlyctochytrium planicorne]|nr:hypothetical protein HDU97_006893 [Phlyctochytrium planicorne]
MGDGNVFGGHTQFSSTMKVDYKAHSARSQWEEERKVAAGKALGITTSSNSEIHVVFGDGRKVQDDRYRSVTSECYRNPEKIVTEEPPRRRIRKTIDKRLESWEGKTELIMSAAHVGTKTREDLPIDNKRFRSFNTTSQDAYNLHPHLYLKSADGKHLQTVPARPQPGTSIPQGDREKQQCYESVAASSFVRHPPTSYGLTQKAEAPPAGAVLEGDSRYRACFATTSGSSYSHPEGAQREVRIIKDRGSSCIAFGESIQADASKKTTGLTVTQRDFREMPQENYVEARKLAAESTKISYVGDGNNLGSAGALRPDKEVSRSLLAHDEHARELAALANLAVDEHRASSGRRGGSDTMYKSSIVTGDPSRYGFGTCHTTTSASFQSYPEAEFPTFPVAGANITRSNFSLGDGVGTDGSKNYMVSTAASAFVDYGRVKRPSRRKPVPSFIGATNVEYPMSDNITSNAQFYKKPSEVPQRIPAVAPKSVTAALLFPLRTHGHQAALYETTMNAFFRTREGIVNITPPQSGILKNDNRLSSIAFGDPTHFDTLGMPIYSQGGPVAS